MMNASDLFKTIQQAGEQDTQNTRIATVTSYSASDGVYLQFYGESAARQKPYKRLSTYTPTAGDKVLVTKINGSYVVTGGIV